MGNLTGRNAWNEWMTLADPFFTGITRALETPTKVDALERFPRINTKEDEKGYYIEAEMPGLTKKEISITVEDNILKLKGEKVTETEEENNDYRHREFKSQKFERNLRLPKTVSTSDIKAKYANGILTLTIPKEEIVPKSIEIEVK
jgi:HSP20 family protein